MSSLALPPYLPPVRDNFARGIRWSLVAHAVVFAIIVLKTLVFPGKAILLNPSLRVDLVGLPDILKKDLDKIPRNPAPDDVAEALKRAEAELKKIPKPVPEEKTEAKDKKVPLAEPDEMVLKPKQTEKAREKKLRGALDRIKALQAIQDEVKAEKPKPSGMIVKGNKISRGTSLSPEAKESAVSSYADVLRDQLQSNWALPVWLSRQPFSAQVRLQIDSHGQILAVHFVKSSGNAQFDDAVKHTIQQSLPFSPPPKEIADTIADAGILVGFPL